MPKGDHRVGLCPQGCQLWPYVFSCEADRYCRDHGELYKEIVGLPSDGDEMRRAMRHAPGRDTQEREYNARQNIARLIRRSA